MLARRLTPILPARNFPLVGALATAATRMHTTARCLSWGRYGVGCPFDDLSPPVAPSPAGLPELPSA
jgi:hypothetical protein